MGRNTNKRQTLFGEILGNDQAHLKSPEHDSIMLRLMNLEPEAWLRKLPYQDMSLYEAILSVFDWYTANWNSVIAYGNEQLDAIARKIDALAEEIDELDSKIQTLKQSTEKPKSFDSSGSVWKMEYEMREKQSEIKALEEQAKNLHSQMQEARLLEKWNGRLPRINKSIQLECPVLHNGRQIGFIDMVVDFDVPFLCADNIPGHPLSMEALKKYSPQLHGRFAHIAKLFSSMPFRVAVEIKPAIGNLGAIMRQINTYRLYERAKRWVVVTASLDDINKYKEALWSQDVLLLHITDFDDENGDAHGQ